ncbi:deoxyribodipyrimidine photolyase [Aquabacterium fontiphilum]|uniref:cryptochrome/deoxyribodipyrimidine photo-lyase family protein n=1 Tax=Aquabacterium fontiphilum TaxID=450365 RepID=UPI001378914E|nr:FAD-binding domain-containing protein [Aquabacterium fontiphilum]NBD20753.1 deoxyribodipyrimidine photolyase [Aquabacterium fontiphilum]
MMQRALVWFKRDLRLRDHAPLAQAAHADEALALFVLEPAWLESPEFDLRHLHHLQRCLAELQADLAGRGLRLLVRVGEATDVLAAVHRAWAFTDLLSHEETGPFWSYERDRAVARWCRRQAVVWTEHAQTGAIRALRARSGWAARWEARMAAAEWPMPDGWRPPMGVAWAVLGSAAPECVPELASVAAAHVPGWAARHPATARVNVPVLPAGERAAWADLASFLLHRSRGYRQHLSSPLTAEAGCSRLSAHLSFGSISMRCVHQATEARIAALRARDEPGDRDLAYHLQGFASRLRWHCHFMQKLESEPEIEWRNFARAYDGLREPDFDRARFEAWCRGETGFPMVDACMRSLNATGWLNFRMRAMLVSVAAYPLWLHWREPGLHLARQFIDFEPGIHWSQMQMQSGTTGINTMRVYSPTKQAQEHDPEGVFIRRWVPELAGVPTEHLAEPWRLSLAGQRAAGCVIGSHYPPPIVDPVSAVREAKARLAAVRRQPEAQREADGVQARHGSRKSGLPSTTRPARARGASASRTRMKKDAEASLVSPSPQLGLFDELS